MSLLALDLTAVVLLLAEKPVLGATVVALAGVAFAQKRLLGRPARA
jgi:hypothetical protein